MNSSIPSVAALVESLELTVSQDRHALQSAQISLEKAAQSDLATYLKLLSEVLAERDNSRVARMAAALQLKNYLTGKGNDSKTESQRRWLSLPDSDRKSIKVNALHALGSEATAAQCVAYIAAAELPLDQWPELVPWFVSKASANNPNGKEREATMEAIGIMCQEISTDVLTKWSNEILQAIVHCMGRDEVNPRVRLAAISALSNSVDFAEQHFETKNERHMIMQMICDATQSDDIGVQVTALQTLVKIASLYYPYLELYMKEAIVCITLNAIESEDVNVSLQGIEFWLSIGEIELDLAGQSDKDSESCNNNSDDQGVCYQSKHYVHNSLQHIAPALMKALSRREEYDDEEDWIPSKAAALCLMMVSHCTRDLCQHILPLIDLYIKKANWKNRHAAAVALGSIVEGQDDRSAPEIEPFVPLMWNLSHDKNVCVRDAAVWAIGRIFEFLPQFIPTKLEILVDGLVERLADGPRVAFSSCWTISALVKAAFRTASEVADNCTPKTFVLSPFYPILCEKLVAVADRPDSNQNNLRSTAYEVLKNMLTQAPDDCYQVLQTTVHQLVDRLQKESSSLEPDDDGLVSLLCTTLPDVLAQLRSGDAASECDSLMDSLMSILASCPDLSLSRPVHEDALLLVSSVVRILGQSFDKHVKTLLPFLVDGLKNVDHSIYLICIGLTGDIFRALDSLAVGYLNTLMPPLIASLSQDNDDKTSMELAAVFGDIVLAVGSAFHPYLKDVSDWMQENWPADEDEMEELFSDRPVSIDQLRETFLETYGSLIEGFKRDESHSAHFRPYLPKMCQIVNAVMEGKYQLSDELFSAAAVLLRHLIIEFSDQIPPELSVDLVNPFLSSAIEISEGRCRTICRWAMEQIEKSKKKVDEIDR